MRIHGLISGSRANGPGLRSVAFVQGCTLSCPSCWNPKTHPFDGGTEWEPDALAEHIVQNAAPGTEGISISGGEPAQALLSVHEFIREVRQKRPAWTIGLFSGYSLEELRSGTYACMDAATWDKRARRLLWNCVASRLDFGILGRYDRTQAVQPLETRPELRMCSSSNQRLVLFSRRYSFNDFEPLSFEYSIAEGGLTQLTGFPI